MLGENKKERLKIEVSQFNVAAFNLLEAPEVLGTQALPAIPNKTSMTTATTSEIEMGHFEDNDEDDS